MLMRMMLRTLFSAEPQASNNQPAHIVSRAASRNTIWNLKADLVFIKEFSRIFQLSRPALSLKKYITLLLIFLYAYNSSPRCKSSNFAGVCKKPESRIKNPSPEGPVNSDLALRAKISILN